MMTSAEVTKIGPICYSVIKHVCVCVVLSQVKVCEGTKQVGTHCGLFTYMQCEFLL